MYHSLLDKVIKAIDQTVGRKPTSNEQWDAFYNQLFNPEAYTEYVEEQRKKETLRNKLVAGATVAAALGEIAHIAHKTDAIGKVARKLKKE